MQLPQNEIQLETSGAVHEPGRLAEVVSALRATAPRDVLVMVHGWNNDMPAARRLYQALAGSMAQVSPSVPTLADATVPVIGVLWPAVAWADEANLAGGGAGLADPEGELITAVLDRVEDPDRAKQLAELVPRLNSSAEARRDYLTLLRETMPAQPQTGVPGGHDEDPAPPALTHGDAGTVFSLAAEAATSDFLGGLGGLAGDPGGAAEVGGAAGFGLSFGGILDAARTALNATTYYTMKDRAGLVGRVGITAVLDAVRAGLPDARLHLVGHSFGARAVTAAAAVSGAGVRSVSLLQGAFSHFGMAVDWDGKNTDGLFHQVPGRVLGPVLVTCTRNDKAVGLAYALASRLARQAGAAIGDRDDPYGGLGSNGALKTPTADDATLLDVGAQYGFAPGRVANLRADRFVSGHGDVTGRQVAYAVLRGMTV
jgi:pimeloyl-ACP methyl ester carboxylesterase